MPTHYLSPGPASLPAAVRERIHAELLDTFGIGVSILEISHRSKQYEALNEETHSLARRVFGVPDSHAVFFTPFGAQQHFALFIAHMSRPGDTISYADTDHWASVAIREGHLAKRNVKLAFSGGPEYRTIPDPEGWAVDPASKFLHLTINNTIYGTEYPRLPQNVKAPLILDLTSSIAARSDIPWARTGIAYASAQKNFGIAGASVVMMERSLLEASKALCDDNLIGNALRFASINDAKSALNTPPVFPIYCINRFLQWIESSGGVAAMERVALEKARVVYSELDKGFYKGWADKSVRSRHNFVFKTPTPELDDKLIKDAAKEGILEIKGYRNTGGIRASAYNGVSLDSCRAFAAFLGHFRDKNG